MNTTTIKGKVEYILQKYTEARNSDKKLIALLWWAFYKDWMQNPEGNKWVIDISRILDLPSPESIRRTRQKFQQEGDYPATDPVVMERRSKEGTMRSSIAKPGWGHGVEQIT